MGTCKECKYFDKWLSQYKDEGKQLGWCRYGLKDEVPTQIKNEEESCPRWITEEILEKAAIHFKQKEEEKG
jgi:hypothetical protein